jgi:hypothetical protein
MLWSLDALRRLLLERMYDPQVVSKLHSVHHSKRITPIRQSNLKHRCPKAKHRLYKLRLATLCSNSKSIKTDVLSCGRKFVEILARSLIQEISRVCLITNSSEDRTPNVVKFDYIRQDKLASTKTAADNSPSQKTAAHHSNN